MDWYFIFFFALIHDIWRGKERSLNITESRAGIEEAAVRASFHVTEARADPNPMKRQVVRQAVQPLAQPVVQPVVRLVVQPVFLIHQIP